jgi:hypothetical protein
MFYLSIFSVRVVLSLIEFTAGHRDEDFIAEAKPHAESSEVETSVCRGNDIRLVNFGNVCIFLCGNPTRNDNRNVLPLCFCLFLRLAVYFVPVVRWRVLLVQKESFVFETPVATRVGRRIQTFKSMAATALTSLFGMFFRFHHPQSEKKNN